MATSDRTTDSGIPIGEVYRPGDVAGWSYETAAGDPGAFPYTRGVYPTMYRGRLWTMRQYGGSASADVERHESKYPATISAAPMEMSFPTAAFPETTSYARVPPSRGTDHIRSPKMPPSQARTPAAPNQASNQFGRPYTNS